MSAECGEGDSRGWGWSENGPKVQLIRESVYRSIRWSFASNRNPVVRCGVSDNGIAHTFAVCMTELANMARGKGSGGGGAAQKSMPTFVDVPLTQEERKAFLEWDWDDEVLLVALQRLCDDGYRVGCTWNGESQSYTVSLTCRDVESPNNGLCMTSFAKTLSRAVALAVYKHIDVSDRDWRSVGSGPGDEFG